MASKRSRQAVVRFAAASVVVGATATVAGAAQSYWDRGGNTDDLFMGSNWSLNNSHPTQTDEAIIDDLHGGATYTTPGVRYFGSTGGGQRFGQLTFDSPTLTTLYAYSTNITTVNPVTLWATPGSNAVLSVGSNVGASGPQTITITDNAGVNGSLYLSLNLTPVTAGDPAVINVTNADATLVIASLLRNSSSDSTAAGQHGIEKTGAGTLVLNFANTFGGANQVVRVSGGTLQVAADNNLGSASNRVVLNGGTLKLANTANLSTSRAFTVAAPSTIDVAGGFSYTINGAIAGSSTLTKTGSAELVMNNAAGTFDGTIQVNQGSVRLLNPAALATGATVKLIGLNSTLNLRRDNGGTYPVNVDATTANAQVFVDRQSVTGGLFTIGDVTLGAVTLNLNGNAANANSLAVGNVTLRGNGTIQTSAIPVTVNGAVGESGGAFGLKKMGGATLVLTKDSTFTGGASVGGGTLEVSSDAQLGAGAAALTVATDYTPTTPSPAVLKVTGSFVSNRPVVAGDGTIENAQDVTFGAVTGSGVLVKAGAGRLTVQSIVGGSLSVGEGEVELAAGGGTSKLAGFAYGTGHLDVTNNRVVFSGPAQDLVRGWLAGQSVVSSVAQADVRGLTAIGYLPVGAAGLDVATWGGLDVAAGDVVTRVTWTGDIDLDGDVDRDDLAQMDRGMATFAAGAAVWRDGDVNYDGSVTSADYLLADRAFAANGNPLSSELLAQREGTFGAGYVAELVAAVPEPTGVGLLAGALLVGARRRRR